MKQTIDAVRAMTRYTTMGIADKYNFIKSLAIDYGVSFSLTVRSTIREFSMHVRRTLQFILKNMRNHSGLYLMLKHI